MHDMECLSNFFFFGSCTIQFSKETLFCIPTRRRSSERRLGRCWRAPGHHLFASPPVVPERVLGAQVQSLGCWGITSVRIEAQVLTPFSVCATDPYIFPIILRYHICAYWSTGTYTLFCLCYRSLFFFNNSGGGEVFTFFFLSHL